MRPILFVFADSQCATTVRGVLDDEKRRHHRLGCAPFDFDPTLDVLQHPEHDPGLYDHGAMLLQVQMRKQPFERVVIILDEAWDSSPGKAKIEAKIYADVVAALKCDPGNVAVICIQPELEAWIWQDSPIVEDAFLVVAIS